MVKWLRWLAVGVRVLLLSRLFQNFPGRGGGYTANCFSSIVINGSSVVSVKSGLAQEYLGDKFGGGGGRWGQEQEWNSRRTLTLILRCWV